MLITTRGIRPCKLIVCGRCTSYGLVNLTTLSLEEGVRVKETMVISARHSLVILISPKAVKVIKLWARSLKLEFRQY